MLAHHEFIRQHEGTLAAAAAAYEAEVKRAAEITAAADVARSVAVATANAHHAVEARERSLAWPPFAAEKLSPVVSAFDGTRGTAIPIREAWTELRAHGATIFGVLAERELGLAFAAAHIAKYPESIYRLANPLAYIGDAFDTGIAAAVSRACTALKINGNPAAWLAALLNVESAVAAVANSGQQHIGGDPRKVFDLIRFAGDEGPAKIAEIHASMYPPPDPVEMADRVDLMQQKHGGNLERGTNAIMNYMARKAQAAAGVVRVVSHVVSPPPPAAKPKKLRASDVAAEVPAIEHPNDVQQQPNAISP